MTQLNLRLKVHRIAAGMTQRNLADAVGVTEVCVSRWETERTKPTQEKRQAVADVLECKAFEIWDQ